MRPEVLHAAVLVLASALASASRAEPLLLRDATAEIGLDFVHFNGMTGELYFPEMTGQGGALFDADGDGDLDLFAVQGELLGPGAAREDLGTPWTGPWPPTHRYFRNLLREEGELRFVDATEESGLGVTGYGMGAATGDVDRDGDLDLLVTAHGPDRLFRNEGDGSFVEVTASAGLDEGGAAWSTSASIVDVDRDGWPDLYVARYVDFDLERNPRCYATSSRPDYCGPSAFAGVADRLWLNRGDGTFEDVSVPAGLAGAPRPGLGVISGDLDGDGRLDLYVANDGVANQLWSWRDGRLVDGALLAGLAVNREGAPEASMGLALGDFDLDGDEDLVVTHLLGETDTFYENRGDGIWEDRTRETGLGAGSLGTTAFGIAWIDLDRDGWLDVAIAAGAVRILEELLESGDPYPLGQSNRLLDNRGGRSFEEISDRAPESFRQRAVSRGLATGDVDDDGDTDLVVFANNGPLRLYLGEPPEGRWLGVDVRDDVGGPAIGARIEIRTEGETMVRRVRADGSYCSASDPRALFGLGSREIGAVSVRWPDGRERTLDPLPVGRYTVVEPPAGDSEGSSR